MLKVRIDGEDGEYVDIRELEESITRALDDARDDGYEDGFNSGRDEGYIEGLEHIDEVYDPLASRETEFRTDLYRAIHKGDIDKAREVMALMAMVDIDREEISNGKR